MRDALGLILLLALGLAIALALGVWLTVHHLRRPPRKTYAWALGRNLPGDPSELESPLHFEDLSLDLREANPSLRRFASSPVWEIKGADPDGPVIIWTPGWGDSRVGALARIRHLAPLASRIIAWDPPGQGESSGLWPMATIENELLVNLARWAARAHDAPIILAGSSMGAGLSIVAAAQLHEREPQITLRAVIAEAPYALPQSPARNYLRATNQPHTWNIRAGYALMGWRLGAGHDWSRAHHGRGFDRAAWAARLPCPLLVLHGERDVISDPEDGRAIAAAAPHATLAMIEGGGHNDLWLKPELAQRCLSAVRDFIRAPAAKDSPRSHADRSPAP